MNRVIVRWALVLAAAAGLAACGGGGGGGDNPSGGASRFTLTVNVAGSGSVTSSPAGISCGTTCSAAFDVDTRVTLTATASAGHALQAWGGACASASGNTCTVAMAQAASVSVTFAALPVSGWSSPAVVLSPGGSGSAKVAIDAAGRALAVWLTLRTGSLSDEDLMASRYEPGTGWSTPVLLETSPRDVMRVELAMDLASGRAIVLWTQASDTSNGAAWARHFDPGTGWTAVAALSSPTGVVDVPSVGIDAQGNAVAAWSQLDAQRFSVWGSRGSAAGAWGTAQLLETMDELGRVDGNPRIAVAPQGDAIVVWQASGGSVANRGTWTNRYSTATGWGSASHLVAVSGGSAPDIAMDANGNAVMVWGQIEPVSATEMYTLIQAKRYQAGSWGAPLRVARDLGANSLLSLPIVKMNAAGAALVAWGQGDLSIRATIAPPGGAWPASTLVKPVGGRSVTSLLRAALDADGHAFLAWAQGNDAGTADAMLASRSPSGGWVAGVPHDTISEIAADPFVAMDARGNALYLWTQYMGSTVGTQVVWRRYVSGR